MVLTSLTISNMKMTPTKEQKDIEKAIKFLVMHINKECRNEKP